MVLLRNLPVCKKLKTLSVSDRPEEVQDDLRSSGEEGAKGGEGVPGREDVRALDEGRLSSR